MRISTLKKLVCPYCREAFAKKEIIRRRGERIDFGLVECGCFQFPIVDGILLLNLSKAYGGAEEALQPYAHLQAASIHCLQQGKISDLRRWMKRNAPLIYQLAENPSLTYLQFMQQYLDRLSAHAEKEFRHLARFRLGPSGAGLRLSRDPFKNFYMWSFLFRDRAQTMKQLSDLSISGSILSLCAGHGVFENLMRVKNPKINLVSMDAQLINLYVLKKYSHPDADLICHDLQFPLPFRDAAFSGVFSSRCVPEVPSHASFIDEAIRVTTAKGWTMFEGVWDSSEDKRVDYKRYYRVIQNEFKSLQTPVSLAQGSSRGKSVYCTKLSEQSLRGAICYVKDRLRIAKLIKDDPNVVMNILVSGKKKTCESLDLGSLWILSEQECRALAWNPGIKTSQLMPTPMASRGTKISLAERKRLTDLYIAGTLTFVPIQFS